MPETERKLPINQLVILSLCRFAEPITYTAVNAYLPSMLEFLGVPELEIGRWVGISFALYSSCQCVTAMIWGFLSDKIGRKSIIMTCLTATMVFSLVWGFSTSLWQAMVARAFLGVFGGNVGILRTAVAELVPWKELQPKAFAIMPILFNIGCVIGPIIGGTLANPYHVEPGKSYKNRLLELFPFALPNIISAALFLIAIIAVFLGFHETLVTKKNQMDIGLLLKDKVVKRWTEWKKVYFGDEKSGEREPLLESSRMQSGGLEEVESVDFPPPKKEPVSWKDILTKQSVLCLVTYSILGLQSGVYDMYIPIFMYHPRQDWSAIHLPLKFSGGFGSSTRTIGAMYAITGTLSIPVQFFFYPYMARRIGVLKCLKVVSLIYPLLYLLSPFITLLPSPPFRLVTLFVVLFIKACLTSFSYPCATVMLSQSIHDTRGLGTLNGILTATSGLARALGPAIGGPSFTIGVKIGYLILPFWIVAGMAVLAMLPVFLLRDSVSETDDGEVEEE